MTDAVVLDFLDRLRTVPGVISVNVASVPEFVQEQISAKEDLLRFCFILDTKDGDTTEADFVITRAQIHENTHTEFATGLKNMLDCDCIRVVEGETDLHYNAFFNAGKNTFFVRPEDGFIVRLKSQAPVRLAPTGNLVALVEKLKAINGVIDIAIEEIIDSDNAITEDFDTRNDDHVMICATVRTSEGTNDVHLAVPESVYASEHNMKWAIEQIEMLVSKQP